MRTIAACALPDALPAAVSLLSRSPPDPLFLRCLVLAVLVHVWLALTLGNRPGSAVPGTGGWGQVAITLEGLGGATTEAEAEAEVMVWRDDGPPGDARSPRHGGRVRALAPPPDSGPGAQRQGRWQSQEVAEAPDRADDEPSGPEASRPAAPAPTANEDEVPPTPTRTLPTETGQRPPLERTPAIEALKAPAAPELSPVAAAVALPDPLLRSLVEPNAPQAPTRGSPAVAAPRSTLATTDLQPTTAQVELPAAEPVWRGLDLPNRVRTVTRNQSSLAAPLPAPAASDLSPVQARVDLPPDEPVLKSLADSAPARLPGRRMASLERPKATPNADLAPVAARVEVPEPAPVLKTLASEGASPRRPERHAAARAPMVATVSAAASTSTGNLRPLEPLVLPRPTATSDGAPPQAAATASPPASPTAGDPVPTPTPGPRLAAGSPDAGAQVGHDVATAPSAVASAPPRPLNLTLPSNNGPTARPSSGLLALLPAVPDTKSKLEKGLEAAQREDCRKAHADKGLLGALPLALDSARGKGCKW